MPDESTYGFNKDDAQELVRLVANEDTEFPEIRPRGQARGSKIFFEVDSAAIAGGSSPYNGKMILTVTIIVAPCDQRALIDTSVDVVDWSTCLANAETVEAVVGRQGWAFRGIAHSLKSGDPTGTLTPCHWALDGLCCPP